MVRLIEPTYFPPISHWKFIKSSDLLWSIYSRYNKQTLTNRTYIDSANGELMLTVEMKFLSKDEPIVNNSSVLIHGSPTQMTPSIQEGLRAYLSSQLLTYLMELITSLSSYREEIVSGVLNNQQKSELMDGHKLVMQLKFQKNYQTDLSQQALEFQLLMRKVQAQI